MVEQTVLAKRAHLFYVNACASQDYAVRQVATLLLVHSATCRKLGVATPKATVYIYNYASYTFHVSQPAVSRAQHLGRARGPFSCCPESLLTTFHKVLSCSSLEPNKHKVAPGQSALEEAPAKSLTTCTGRPFITLRTMATALHRVHPRPQVRGMHGRFLRDSVTPTLNRVNAFHFLAAT